MCILLLTKSSLRQPGRSSQQRALLSSADHGIPDEEVEEAFKTGQDFLKLKKEEKEKYPFNPDTYLGYRGPDELETVTGTLVPQQRCYSVL